MEQEYPDDGKTFGCAVIYGALLALTGIVLAAYVLLDGVPASVATAMGGEGAVTAIVLLGSLTAVVVGAGLWYEMAWARRLVVLLHSLGALLGIGVALLPLVSRGPALSALATPATALMGVVVNVVIVAWLLRKGEPEDGDNRHL